MTQVQALPLQATLISHTHWDRAWYVTFQEYRVRLVRLIDRLLNTLENDPGFRVFMLDGQMSVLDDYLEARPGQAERLHKLAREGRILVGPWFVLADEFLVSPESLIRNLALGHALGKPYGGVASIGYVPDGFGHIAQLPQILRGFGIDNAFFWRGMGVEGDQLGTEFMWHAPDGSTVTTILMPWGYHNVTNLGYGIHWGDVSQMAFNPDLALKKIDQAIRKLERMTNTGTILLMNGIDHAEAEPRIPAIIGHANESIEGVEITHGTLSEHLAKVRARVRAAGKVLPSFEGEFRWGRYSEILPGVYSTRIHLKQQNHAHEVLLERYLEPLCALAWAFGAPIDEGTPDLIALAWRWLLLNHPHDDMYGSGIDEVHHEMAFRFSQARQIADVLIRDSFRQIAVNIEFGAQAGTPILLFNPLGFERNDVTEAVLELDFDDPTANAFQVIDSSGKVIAHQVISDDQVFWMEVLKPNRKRRLTVLLKCAIPACGFSTLYLKPKQTAIAPTTDLIVHTRGAENNRVRFTIEADGGLNIVEKSTGRIYTGFNHFYDVDDAGDEYSSAHCTNSHSVTTKGKSASVTLIETGRLRIGFRIQWDLAIPESLTPDRNARSATTVNLSISSNVYLYADAPAIQVVTTIHNSARDHKLSVVFPTDLHSPFASVDAAFMVAKRDLNLPTSEGWVEDPSPLMHQRAFIDLNEGNSSLAILNRGLPSVEAHTDGSIYLTLLRAVGWLSRDDLTNRRVAAGPLVPTPGAQCLGDYRYEYAILPHTGGYQAIYGAASAYTVPTYARRADTHPGLELREMNITRDDPALVTAIPWPRGGPIQDGFSLINIDRADIFVLSAVYRSGDALIVRLFNITREPQNAVISFGVALASVELVRMDETLIRALHLENGSHLQIEAKGAEVITLRLTLRHLSGS